MQQCLSHHHAGLSSEPEEGIPITAQFLLGFHTHDGWREVIVLVSHWAARVSHCEGGG